MARNATGSALVSQNIKVRISVRDLSPTGAVVYTETRSVTTSTLGLFNIVVGSGGATNVTGTIAGINWSAGTKYLWLEIDPLGGTTFIDMGTTQLQSVPYAVAANPIGTAGGDLSGTYPAPVVSANAITTAKIADGNVTDAKIATVSATKVTGTLPIANGGTGGTTATDAKTNLGLQNVDNTSDANKPVSTAQQTALNAKVNSADTASMLNPYYRTAAANAALALKEDVANKSTTTTLGTSNTLYPSQNAVKTYVDAQTTADATTTATGKVQLAGDLGGTGTTAVAPIISNSAITTSKIADGNVTDAKIATVSATKITGTLPIANGGTGSATQNFVDLTTTQTVAGNKTFNSDVKVNSLTLGLGMEMEATIPY